MKMATHQTSNQRHGANSGQFGQQSPGRGQTQSSAGKGSREEQSSGMYGAVSSMAEEASDYVAQGASQVQECIREYSGSAVVVSLIAGFGIGLAIGKVLSGSHSQPQSWR